MAPIISRGKQNDSQFTKMKQNVQFIGVKAEMSALTTKLAISKLRWNKKASMRCSECVLFKIRVKNSVILELCLQNLHPFCLSSWLIIVAQDQTTAEGLTLALRRANRLGLNPENTHSPTSLLTSGTDSFRFICKYFKASMDKIAAAYTTQ